MRGFREGSVIEVKDAESSNTLATGSFKWIARVKTDIWISCYQWIILKARILAGIWNGEVFGFANSYITEGNASLCLLWLKSNLDLNHWRS